MVELVDSTDILVHKGDHEGDERKSGKQTKCNLGAMAEEQNAESKRNDASDGNQVMHSLVYTSGVVFGSFMSMAEAAVIVKSALLLIVFLPGALW